MRSAIMNMYGLGEVSSEAATDESYEALDWISQGLSAKRKKKRSATSSRSDVQIASGGQCAPASRITTTAMDQENQLA
jgi:hypothetical protein